MGIKGSKWKKVKCEYCKKEIDRKEAESVFINQGSGEYIKLGWLCKSCYDHSTEK